MSRSKVGKKRPNPSPDVFAKAVSEVLDKGMSIRATAAAFSISKSALCNRIKEFKTSEQTEFTYKPKYDVHRVFSDSEEDMLVEFAKKCSYLHYGLTVNSLRKLAYDFAKHNNVKYPSSWDKDKKAGEFWYRLFRQRHNDLSVRKPEGTSIARSTAFNKATVANFFENYKAALKKADFLPSRIWNLDETGVVTVQQPPKVLATKGQKQVGAMTSAERGVNVTLISAVNAAGNFLPPFFVFPRVHFKQHMLNGAPPGSAAAANPSGWSNEDIFIQYFDFFISHTKPSKDDPILLLLDNVDSHISFPVVKKAREVGIIMVTFHPHTTHRMQPLDRSVFGPFKTYYHQFITDWMVTPGNHGKPLTIYDIASIVGKAYPLAFTPTNIISGFNCTGLFPCNSQVFGEQDFLPSNVTDRPEREELLDDTSINAPCQLSPSQTHYPPSPSEQTRSCSYPESSTSSNVISPEMLRPFPKAPPRKTSNQGRKKGKSRILTDTPEKNKIELDYQRKVEKKLFIQKKVKGGKKKRKRFFGEISSEESECDPILSEHSSSGGKMDFEQEIMTEELERQFENEAIESGDYVFVKLAGKKFIKYFVALITEKVGKTYFNVKYLKKIASKDNTKFVFNEKQDVYEIECNDIVFKLPPPQKIGSTDRQSNIFIFPVDFSGFSLG